MAGRVPDHLAGVVDGVGLSALNRAEGPEVRHHVGARRSGGSLPLPGERGKEDEGEKDHEMFAHGARERQRPCPRIFLGEPLQSAASRLIKGKRFTVFCVGLRAREVWAG